MELTEEQKQEKLQKARESVARTRQKYKDAHLCTKCGGKLEPGDKSLCKFCRRKAHLTYKDQRQKRINNHECTDCGVPLPEGYEGTRCDNCRTKKNEISKKSRQKWKGRTARMTTYWHPHPEEQKGLCEGTRYWITVETDNGLTTADVLYVSGEFRSRDGVYDGAAVKAWAPYEVPKPYKGG